MSKKSISINNRIELNTKNWLPDNEIKAVIIILHGLAEHIERYNHVGIFFSSSGYAVEAYDQRGHGKSLGKRGLIKSIKDYVSDLRIFLNNVKQHYPGKQIFLLGHSMGGEISCLYSIKYQSEISGLILCGAVIKLSMIFPNFSKNFQGLSGLFSQV